MQIYSYTIIKYIYLIFYSYKKKKTDSNYSSNYFASAIYVGFFIWTSYLKSKAFLLKNVKFRSFIVSEMKYILFIFYLLKNFKIIWKSSFNFLMEINIFTVSYEKKKRRILVLTFILKIWYFRNI